MNEGSFTYFASCCSKGNNVHDPLNYLRAEWFCAPNVQHVLTYLKLTEGRVQ